MDEDTRRRVTQTRDNDDAKRQATQQTVNNMLVIAKRSGQTEPENDRVKRQVETHLGEPVNVIPYLPTAAVDVMDARAQAVQDNARIAEVQTTTFATGSSDFDRLAEVTGERTGPVEYSIATPRGRTLEREPKRTRRETNNTIRGALATIAADKRKTAPENVDSDAPPKVRKSARTQNNFSRELTADEILDFKLKTKPSKTIVSKDKKVRKTIEKDKRTASETIVAKDKEKPLAIGDTKVSKGPSTNNAPKISQATKEEQVISPKEMQFWQDLETKQIIEKIIAEFPRHKKKDTLSKMRKPTLLKYAMKLEESRNKVGQRNRAVRVK
jgi:hypothetical protein